MIVKAEVTAEEKERIKALAKSEGKSVSSYIRTKALCWNDQPAEAESLMKLIEAQAPVLQRVNEIATTVIENKVIYEAEILALIDCMTWIEDVTAAAVKEVTRSGNIRQQEHP